MGGKSEKSRKSGEKERDGTNKAFSERSIKRKGKISERYLRGARDEHVRKSSSY